MESFVSMTWDEIKSLADDLPAWGEKTSSMAGSAAWKEFEAALDGVKRDIEYRVACEVLRYDGFKTCITVQIRMNPSGSKMPPVKVAFGAENTDNGAWTLHVGSETDLEGFAEQAKIEAGLVEILEAHGFGG